MTTTSPTRAGRSTAHTARGATLLGLARYTALNARLAQGKKADVKPMVVSFMVAGRKREMTVPEDEAAEHRDRYERDPEPLRLRAVELFEEVVAGYTATSRSVRRARPSPAWRPTPWRSSAPSRSASPPRRSPA